MIKNKLSDIISTQLPDHIRESYPTFVEFLQAYYKFLETQTVYRNLETIRDVDETLDIFIDKLKREYAADFPEFAKERTFLKNTPHIAVSHGSEESYRFLFRKMFQKEVDIRYPREQLLSVSDSKWVQDYSIFVRLDSGDINSLQNTNVQLNTTVNNKPHKNRVYVKRVESVLTSESVYELFINKDYYGKILLGDTINQNGVTATVVSTTSNIKIIKPGFGFKVGQVFNIESAVGSGLTFRITEVTNLGGIKSVQIINYGVNFNSGFTFELPSTFVMGDAVETTLGTPIKINSYSSIQRYIDSGFISRQNYYNETYSTDYVGQVQTAFNTTTVAEEITANSAKLEVILGTVSKYQGYYENSTGLVSSPDSVIQDNNYYQKFSYVLRIDEALSEYKDTVLSILHPIGRKLFAEYVVDNVFELNYEIVEPVFRILLPLFSGIPSAVSLSTQLSFLFDKPVESIELVTDDKFYVFDKVTNTDLTSFNDPTILPEPGDTSGVISGRVKGSNKIYLFDSLKDSPITLGSDKYWLFEAQKESILAAQLSSTTYALDRPLESTQSLQSSHFYLFDQVTNTDLTSFNDPTILDAVSGRVQGSHRTYVFDAVKDSPITLLSAAPWQFDQVSSSTLPTQDSSTTYLFDQVSSSTLPTQDSSTTYVFDAVKDSPVIPQSDKYWLFDQVSSSTLPTQNSALFYDLDYILNTTLPDQTFVAAIKTERPVDSSISTPSSAYALDFAHPENSTISTPSSSTTYVFDQVSSSTLPTQTFTLLYSLDQALDSTLASQVSAASYLFETPFASSITTPDSAAALSTDLTQQSSINTPTSSITDFVFGSGLSSTLDINAQAPVIIIDPSLVYNSSVLPGSAIAYQADYVLASSQSTLLSEISQLFETPIASSITTGFILNIEQSTLYESFYSVSDVSILDVGLNPNSPISLTSALNHINSDLGKDSPVAPLSTINIGVDIPGISSSVTPSSSPSLDVGLPPASGVSTTDDDTLVIDKGISSTPINNDSGNVFFNPYNEDLNYFASETYLAQTRTF